MSAMKEVLVDVIEMVEERLVEMDVNIDIMVELYDKAGGDKAYQMWCGVYGEELVNNWLEENKYRNMDEHEMFVEGIVYGLTSYIKWLKMLN